MPSESSDHRPLLAGWREIVALPDWGIRRIRAKLDTGARTSVIHVADLEVVAGDLLRFDIVLARNEPLRRIRVEAPLTRIARVRSSTGHEQVRYFVQTRMRLGPVDRLIEISLVCRARMRHRMLLGRSALAGDFIVDPARRYLVSTPRRRRVRGAGP